MLMHGNFIADGSLLKEALVLQCCPGSSQRCQSLLKGKPRKSLGTALGLSEHNTEDWSYSYQAKGKGSGKVAHNQLPLALWSCAAALGLWAKHT